jgi:hypothetical protein
LDREGDKVDPETIEEAVEALLNGDLNQCLVLPNGGEIKFANDEQTQPENGEEEVK